MVYSFPERFGKEDFTGVVPEQFATTVKFQVRILVVAPICFKNRPGGEIGKHRRLKISRHGLSVQVRPWTPCDHGGMEDTAILVYGDFLENVHNYLGKSRYQILVVAPILPSRRKVK